MTEDMTKDNPYSNREIDRFFETMKSMTLEQNVHLKEIKDQVYKTNGRVSGLENWKWMLSGGIAVLTALLVPIIIFIFTKGL